MRLKIYKKVLYYILFFISFFYLYRFSKINGDIDFISKEFQSDDNYFVIENIIQDNSEGEFAIVVVEKINKDTVKYVSVNKDMLPAMYKYSGNYFTHHSKMNVWKCEVVGEFSPDNWTAYRQAIVDYNRNMNLRKEFWKNHPVLSGLNIPYQYYDMRFDVLNGELPTRMWPGHRQIWYIFKNCIDEKLRLELENQ